MEGVLPSADLVVRVPSGRAPPDGWPVFVFLHGCGERASDYARLAALAAEYAVAGVAPSGPLLTAYAGRSWAADLTSTDDCVQSSLGWLGDGPRLNCGCVYLCGFSQGATHAYGLLAARPDRYAGAVVLSPGEGPEPPDPPPGCERRPVYVSFGQGEYRAFRQRARKWASRWRRFGHPCLLDPHPGGHQLPGDWGDRFPRIVSWLGSDIAAHVDGSSAQRADAEPRAAADGGA